MEEEQLLLLRSQGYDYSPYGAIIDSSGNYVKSVKFNKQEVFSGISKESFNVLKDEESVLKEQGYVYNPNSGQTAYDQHLFFKAKLNVADYFSFPDSLKLDQDNPYVNNAVLEYKEKQAIEINKSVIEINQKELSEAKSKNEIINQTLNFGGIVLLILLIFLTLKKILK